MIEIQLTLMQHALQQVLDELFPMERLDICIASRTGYAIPDMTFGDSTLSFRGTHAKGMDEYDLVIHQGVSHPKTFEVIDRHVSYGTRVCAMSDHLHSLLVKLSDCFCYDADDRYCEGRWNTENAYRPKRELELV